MKFLLDANIPYSAKKVFSKPHRAAHVRDIGIADAADDVILKRASKEGAVLITRDMDFGNILLYPLGTHGGVMILRIPPHFTAGEIIKTLRQFLSHIDVASLARAITIIEPGQYRIRR
jgi:predicted nuclease of predicted toxin-antitoxin system